MSRDIATVFFVSCQPSLSLRCALKKGGCFRSITVTWLFILLFCRTVGWEMRQQRSLAKICYFRCCFVVDLTSLKWQCSQICRPTCMYACVYIIVVPSASARLSRVCLLNAKSNKFKYTVGLHGNSNRLCHRVKGQGHAISLSLSVRGVWAPSSRTVRTVDYKVEIWCIDSKLQQAMPFQGQEVKD